MPELSFGSHLFNDLVETGIFYASIFEDNNTVKYDPDFFQDEINILLEICPDCCEIINILKVFDVSNMGLMLFSDIISNQTICWIIKK